MQNYPFYCPIRSARHSEGVSPSQLVPSSACSWGTTKFGSKPSISATLSAVFGSILPYVLKIACTIRTCCQQFPQTPPEPRTGRTRRAASQRLK